MNLKRLVSNALEQTAPLWTPLTIAYDWVHQAAAILDNPDELGAEASQQKFTQLLQEMAQHKAQTGALSSGIDHFLKVTQSYEPGLFHCYDVAGLPRTNNRPLA